MFAATSIGILPSNPPFTSIPLPLPLPLPHLHSSSSSLVFLATTKTHFSLSSSSSSSSISNYSNQEEEEDEDEQVIGDCLVFEDGIFEDPFLQQHSNPNPNPNPTPEADNPNNSNSNSNSNSDSLVPEEWAEAVEEINLTKQQRRKIAQQTQFGQRIFKKKAANSVNLEEFMRFQDYKLSQLKPLVLDNPPKQDYSPVTHSSSSLSSSSSSSRVEPKNPRWAVYGRSLDDVSEFFNSPKYQEEGAASQSKSQGRQKLFTKEEKVLMNARKPTLAIATSIKWLPLHSLAASGEFYLLNNLMKYEVDINAVDQDGLTALHKAIICKKQAITNYLLRESANSSIRDKDGATLMHYAVRAASTESIKTLLLYNVDINTQDNEGWSPLHLAVQGRRTDIVRLLLMKGADKTLKNQDGATPLELCLYSGRDSRTYQLIKLLKELPRPRQHR